MVPMTSGEISLISSGMPASALSALSIAADTGPKRSVVLPVTMAPSGSSMAAAGLPVLSATPRAAGTTARSSGSRFSELISSSILLSSAPEDRPWRTWQAALK